MHQTRPHCQEDEEVRVPEGRANVTELAAEIPEHVIALGGRRSMVNSEVMSQRTLLYS